jgi:RecQ family ATP-dependent DNA helicase
MNRLLEVLKEYWGYNSFRPFQGEAMQSILDGKDSLVVLPTGGGKSLCFQAPALALDGLVVVISPLISLMKDQVDGLVDCGIEAACLNSTLSPDQQGRVMDAARCGTLKLLYVAPERIMSPGFLEFLGELKLAYFVVDEAHCVSMWGHDFRPEYRKLSALKQAFPHAAIHAYTATATEHVRSDITQALGLSEPTVLVGSFDRPNLTYRFQRRGHIESQLVPVLERFHGESGVIYCIRRRDVDRLAAQLQDAGYDALPYHAGLPEHQRREHQDRFIQEDADIIVATVAFGMGIDKSNVRYVIHLAMPKSLEHYQQESGRAGRDGLPAECHLFYDRNDYDTWVSILSDQEGPARDIGLGKLDELYAVCKGNSCRHKAILAYFGQGYEKSSCDACDVCLDGPVAPSPEPVHALLRTESSALSPSAPPDLFEVLRRLRRQEARRRDLRPYMVFNDVSLHDMVEKRPTKTDSFRCILGVGKKKAKTYGNVFCTAIREFCAEASLETDLDCDPFHGDTPSLPRSRATAPKPRELAFELFGQEYPVEDVARQVRRPGSAVLKYLEAYILDAGLTHPYPWVSDEIFERVSEVVEIVGMRRVRSVRNMLGEEVSPQEVPICLACLRNREFESQ